MWKAVRAPDAAFILRERIPASGVPKGYWEGAPDIVIEVFSPWDTQAEIRTKVREWLEGGARLVLVAYPETQTVEVVRSLQERVILAVEDVLDASDVLSGFTVNVGDIFA